MGVTISRLSAPQNFQNYMFPVNSPQSCTWANPRPPAGQAERGCRRNAGRPSHASQHWLTRSDSSMLPPRLSRSLSHTHTAEPLLGGGGRGGDGEGVLNNRHL